VAPGPLREALRFVSFAPHISLREFFAERFSEGVFAFYFMKRKRASLNLNFAFPASASRKTNRDTGTGKPGCTRGTF
jgi:lauroyl/myristoyl acyltransferase